MRGNRSKEQRPYPTKKTEIDNRRPSHRKLTFQAVRSRTGFAVLGCDHGWHWHTDFGSVCQLRFMRSLPSRSTTETPFVGGASLPIYFKHRTSAGRIYFGRHEPRQRVRCRLHPDGKRTRSHQARLPAVIPFRRRNVNHDRLHLFCNTEVCGKDPGAILLA